METISKQEKAKIKPNQDQIASLAYRLWDKGGRTLGRDLDYWLQAEKQLMDASRPSRTHVPAPPAKPALLNDPQRTRANGSGPDARAPLRSVAGRS
jgi:hypothetical protein